MARGTGHVHCTVSPSPESLPPVDTRTAVSSNFTLGDLDFPMSGVRMLGGEQELGGGGGGGVVINFPRSQSPSNCSPLQQSSVVITE